MPKFDTTIADKTHSVQYVIKPNKTYRIIRVSGTPFNNMRDGQVSAVLTRLRSECMQHHEGTLFAAQRGEA